MCRSGEETVGFLHRRLTRCEGIHGRDLKTIALTGDDVLQLCVCVYHHQINKMRRLGLSVRPSDTAYPYGIFVGSNTATQEALSLSKARRVAGSRDGLCSEKWVTYVDLQGKSTPGRFRNTLQLLVDQVRPAECDNQTVLRRWSGRLGTFVRRECDQVATLSASNLALPQKV